MKLYKQLLAMGAQEVILPAPSALHKNAIVKGNSHELVFNDIVYTFEVVENDLDNKIRQHMSLVMVGPFLEPGVRKSSVADGTSTYSIKLDDTYLADNHILVFDNAVLLHRGGYNLVSDKVDKLMGNKKNKILSIDNKPTLSYKDSLAYMQLGFQILTKLG